jgi:hypothetical protein
MIAAEFCGTEPDIVGDRADGRPPEEAVTHEDGSGRCCEGCRARFRSDRLLWWVADG